MTYLISVVVGKEKAAMTYNVTYNDLQSDLLSKRKTKSIRASRLLYVVRLSYPLYVALHGFMNDDSNSVKGGINKTKKGCTKNLDGAGKQK